MHYTGQNYRPPTEALTARLEVTVGCSHNKCSFCSMYNKTAFSVSPLDTVEKDLQEILEEKGPDVERIFLMNGDPFVLSPEKLLKIAELIHRYLKKVHTITCYCSILDLKSKSVEELKALRAAGYHNLYVGIETGYEPALLMINKGCNLEEIRENLGKLQEAGIDYVALLMLGIAGKGNSEANVRATAALLKEFPPVMLTPLSTTVQKGTKLADFRDAGEYVELTEREMIAEELMLLDALELPADAVFNAAHMYNLIPVSGTIGERDKIREFILDEQAFIQKEAPALLDSVWDRFSM